MGPDELGLTVRLPQRELSVEPGAGIGGEVVIHNTGQVVDQYTIEVLGGAGDWTMWIRLWA